MAASLLNLSSGSAISQSLIAHLANSHRLVRRESDQEKDENIVHSIEDAAHKLEDKEQKQRLAPSEINWGVTILGNSIRFISAIFTILGGDSVDRVDGYDTAVSSFFTLGGSVLKYFSGYILSNGVSGNTVDRIDYSGLTPEQILEKKKIQEYIASMSPEEIKKQQNIALNYVQEEAIKTQMTEEEAQALLIQTLKQNGLPLIDGLEDPSDQDIDLLAPISGVVTGAGDAINNLLGISADKQDIPDATDDIPGLPTPGTLEYTVTMALHQANERINLLLQGLTGGSQINTNPNNKIGQADNQIVTDPVSALIAQISSALSPSSSELAVSLNPTSSSTSSVVTSISPVALGVGAILATGLLGGVAYGAANRRSDFTESATSMAKETLDKLRNIPVVAKMEEIFKSITGNKFGNKKDGGDTYIFYPDYDSTYTGVYSDYSSYNSGYSDPRIENYENLVEYPDYDYVDPRERVQAPSQPARRPAHHRNPAPRHPTGETGKESFTAADAAVAADSNVPTNIQFYEPRPEIDAEIEVIEYEEKNNPWHYLYTGESTEHLYSRNLS